MKYMRNICHCLKNEENQIRRLKTMRKLSYSDV